MTRTTDIAWAAGLFEGEGYLYVSKGRYPTPQIGLNMNDRDVVERFAAIMECGSIRIYDSPNPNHSRQYRWRVCGWARFESVTEMLLPYLGDRRTKRIAAVAAVKSAKWRVKGTGQTHCVHGHEYTNANTRIVRQTNGRGGSGRRCRECERERKRDTSR